MGGGAGGEGEGVQRERASSPGTRSRLWQRGAVSLVSAAPWRRIGHLLDLSSAEGRAVSTSDLSFWSVSPVC